MRIHPNPLETRIVARFVAEASNVIIMNINRGLKRSLQKMATVLQQGSNIVIFPEGTRTKNGQLGLFKPTFAILSREFNVPIGSRFPKLLQKISINFRPPIFPKRLDAETLSAQVRQDMLRYVS